MRDRIIDLSIVHIQDAIRNHSLFFDDSFIETSIKPFLNDDYFKERIDSIFFKDAASFISKAAVLEAVAREAVASEAVDREPKSSKKDPLASLDGALRAILWLKKNNKDLNYLEAIAKKSAHEPSEVPADIIKSYKSIRNEDFVSSGAEVATPVKADVTSVAGAEVAAPVEAEVASVAETVNKTDSDLPEAVSAHSERERADSNVSEADSDLSETVSAHSERERADSNVSRTGSVISEADAAVVADATNPDETKKIAGHELLEAETAAVSSEANPGVTAPSDGATKVADHESPKTELAGAAGTSSGKDNPSPSSLVRAGSILSRAVASSFQNEAISSTEMIRVSLLTVKIDVINEMLEKANLAKAASVKSSDSPSR